ncbi:MAG: type 4 pilus major pilin [Alphaproteobacteria bacterium]
MMRHISLKQRGFTLTEFAIILFVAGILIAGVWMGAGAVWDSYRAYRANQQMATVVLNIRENFISLTQWPDAVGFYLTQRLDQRNIFPLEMRRNPAAGAGGGPIDSVFNNNFTSGTAPVNGSFNVQVETGAGGLRNAFRVSFTGLTRGPCIKLLSSIPINNAELGIIKIGTQNMAGGTSTTTMTSMITPTQARTWCNAAGNNNEVDINFKLRN